MVAKKILETTAFAIHPIARPWQIFGKCRRSRADVTVF
jgi:hypothetical protein